MDGNKAYLETLLLESSLGNLPEETKWLIEAYLKDHPEHREEAVRLQLTTQLASRALRAAAPERTPLPSMPRLRPSSGFFTLRPLLWPVACVGCLLLGWFLPGPASRKSDFTRPSVTPRIATSPNPVLARQPGAMRDKAGDDSGGLWSTRRWIESRSAPRKKQPAGGGIEWNGPLRPKWTGGIQ